MSTTLEVTDSRIASIVNILQQHSHDSILLGQMSQKLGADIVAIDDLVNASLLFNELNLVFESCELSDGYIVIILDLTNLRSELFQRSQFAKVDVYWVLTSIDIF